MNPCICPRAGGFLIRPGGYQGDNRDFVAHYHETEGREEGEGGRGGGGMETGM
jgi:hypothetical protein